MFKESVSLSLKRAFPYLLKDRFYFNVSVLNAAAANTEEPGPSNEERFLNRLLGEGLSLNGESGSFRFFHFNGPHPGTCLREDGTLAPSPTSEEEALCGDFRIINEYLSEMKRLGVYESSTVIITADHGHSGLSASEGYLDPILPAGMLMMVKPAGQSEGFSISDARVCTDDILPTVMDGLGFDPSPYGTPIYDVSDPDRVRDFWYSALFSDLDGEIGLVEYLVDGPSDGLSNYHPSGEYYNIVYSHNRVSSTDFTPDLLKNKPESD